MPRTPTSILLGAEAPRVLTIPMLAAVLADRRKLPARNTLFRWLYLGASKYSKIAGPPLDLELERLHASRLRRLARTMGLTEELAVWRARKRDYDADPDVRENIAKDLDM